MARKFESPYAPIIGDLEWVLEEDNALKLKSTKPSPGRVNVSISSFYLNLSFRRLVACRRKRETRDSSQDWSSFLESAHGSQLFLSTLKKLTGLVSLTLQNVATNETLRVVSGTCSKLCSLDISYSPEVTDLGLVYLCGLAIPTYDRVVHTAPKAGLFLEQKDGMSLNGRIDHS